MATRTICALPLARPITSESGDSMMTTKASVSSAGNQTVRAMREQSLYVSERKDILFLKLVVAWTLVLLPFAWGVYEAVQMTAPLLVALAPRS
jgi:hypothetical protein